jgi:alpha-beta hydrolase superfamily lysophospholipase
MIESPFVDRHGVEVFSRWWPRDEPVGTVAISHGASEHSGRYERFARALNGAELAACAIDHRGHGLTGRSSGQGAMGPGGGDALLQDLDELVGRAVARQPGIPVALFGHSMGSLIALAYATRHADRLGALVLCGFPSPVEGAEAQAELFKEAAAAGMRDVPLEGPNPFNDPFAPARTEFDWLSRDPDEVDRYIADPLCGPGMPLTYGFVLDMLTVITPAIRPAALAAITCPVLVIAGDRDPATGMGEHASGLARALHEAGVEPVDCRLYSGARHELLNETNRDEVTSDVIEWLLGIGMRS